MTKSGEKHNMNNYNILILEQLIEETYENKKEITTELLAQYLQFVSSAGLAEILCTYINGMKKIANKQDLKELCTLKLELKNQEELNTLLQHRTNALTKENLQTMKKAMTLKARMQDLEYKNKELLKIIDSKNTLIARYENYKK